MVKGFNNLLDSSSAKTLGCFATINISIGGYMLFLNTIISLSTCFVIFGRPSFTQLAVALFKPELILS
jgi:hypothetical protein